MMNRFIANGIKCVSLNTSNLAWSSHAQRGILFNLNNVKFLSYGCFMGCHDGLVYRGARKISNETSCSSRQQPFVVTSQYRKYDENSSNGRKWRNRYDANRFNNRALVMFVAATAYTTEKIKHMNRNRAECCGIIGYIGSHSAEPILSEGIRILQNRGYDSCGMTTVDTNHLYTSKLASKGSTSDCIEMLAEKAPSVHKTHKIGIAHTRWATHGAKTDENAHPHHDYKNRISLVHNGTIENYTPLKKRLISKGIVFKSETDTEVIANLIGDYLDNGKNFEEAVTKATEELRGTWGLVVLHKDFPDRLILARNGSPLLVGTAEDQIFVASEPIALARHTGQFMSLRDGEIAVITANGIENMKHPRELETIHDKDVELSPSPFSSWTQKEIFEQPQSLARALNYGGRIGVDDRIILGGLDNKPRFQSTKHMLLSGCGTSLYASMYGELIMRYCRSFDSVRAIDSSEVDAHSFPKNLAESALLLVSQSGETLDVIRVCHLADECGLLKLSVVNVVGSLLARLTNCGVYLNAGREVAVASTKAFTSQVTVLCLIASWFAQRGNAEYPNRISDLMAAIHRVPVYAGMTLSCEEACEKIVEKIKDTTSMFILGKGFGYPVALEGALKIKELSYIHAEGFAGGSLKHGPFALVDPKVKTPVILLILSDEHAAAMLNAAEQLKARGARLICITDDEKLVRDVADDVILVPTNGPLTALLASIPLQFIAYHLSLKRGINPDKPRGLAKTVTVY